MIRFRNATAQYHKGITLTLMLKKLEVYEYAGQNQVQTRDHGYRPQPFGGTITIMATTSAGLQGERQKWYAERGQVGTLYIQYQGQLSNVRLMNAVPVEAPIHSPLSTGDDWIQHMQLSFQQESV